MTEDAVYDRTSTEGKGKNKKTTVVHVGPTSYRDLTKRAWSLAEQTLCLAKKTNDLGYRCKPLSGDIFDYQDYCFNTLHMNLELFNVILKDILASASHIGKYGPKHLAVIGEKESRLSIDIASEL